MEGALAPNYGDPDRQEEFEVHALACFIMATNNVPKAVRLGKTHRQRLPPMYFVHLDNQVEASNALPQLIFPTSGTRPWRMYLDVDVRTGDRICEEALDLTLANESTYLQVEKGSFARIQSTEIRLHVCAGGVGLTFDSKLPGLDTFWVPLGKSLPGYLFHNFVPPLLDPRRVNIERSVMSCFKTHYKTNRYAIRIGRGNFQGMDTFVQFEAVQPPSCPRHQSTSSSFMLRAYRVYVPLMNGLRSEIPKCLVDTTLCSDESFKEHHNGQVVGPMAVEVHLHACPRGVFVHYTCGFPPHLPFNVWLGSTGKRENCYAIQG